MTSIYQAAEEAFGGDRELQRRVTIANLNPKQRLVLSVIKNRPEAADSDAVLQAEVWLREGWNHNLSLEDNLRRVTHAETLSRRRRELFNLGLIEYSPKAMKTRTEAFKKEVNNSSSYIAKRLSYYDKDEHNAGIAFEQTSLVD